MRNESQEPYSCKKWKAEFSRSSSAAFTSVKSFSCRELERSSTEKGMLHSEELVSWFELSEKDMHIVQKKKVSPGIFIQQEGTADRIVRILCH